MPLSGSQKSRSALFHFSKCDNETTFHHKLNTVPLLSSPSSPGWLISNGIGFDQNLWDSFGCFGGNGDRVWVGFLWDLEGVWLFLWVRCMVRVGLREDVSTGVMIFHLAPFIFLGLEF